MMALLPGNLSLGAEPLCKDTLSMKIYFPQGVGTIQPSFRDNRYQMASFQVRLKELQQSGAMISSILVTTAASPEGSSVRNRELAGLRADSIRQWLLGIEGIDDSVLTVVPVGEDWEGLADALRSLDQPWRDGALSIVLNTPEWVVENGVVVDSRKKRLMNYEGGKAWYYLEEHVFPELRHAGGEINCIFEYKTEPQIQTVRDTVSITQTVTVRDTVFVDRAVPQPLPAKKARKTGCSLDDYKPVLAFRTNFLAVPLANLGIEIPMGNSFSLGLDWYYPWIWRPRQGEEVDVNGWCFQFMAAGTDFRYWFPRSRRSGRSQEATRLLGHSIGLYGAVGHYDFEYNYSGHQGWFYNVGIDYKYACPIFRDAMRLEFELGFGYIYSPAQPYDCFVAGEYCYRRKGITHYVRWFGPTKAEVSLVVPIRSKDKKGGKR